MTAISSQLLSLPGLEQPIQANEPIAARRQSSTRRMIRARWDAAQTTDENRRHWANADALSARAAADAAVRRTLRIRTRYEVANCPLALGIVHKWANFVVGTGPRLQVKSGTPAYAAAVQRRFNEWAVATKFYHKLWLLIVDEMVNGESFGIFLSNFGQKTAEMPVTLDIRQVEADQFANPAMTGVGVDDGGDGIIFDDFGNPIAYTVLRSHPGDTFAVGALPSDFDRYRADEVYHYFRPMRVGQVRGVSKLAPSLPLFAYRRRFLLATVNAAEQAASVAGVFQSPADDEPSDAEAGLPFESIELDRGMFVNLPGGKTMSQLEAEHPATTLEMFERVLVKEVSRPINMPYAIAAGDSSESNFASGKLDHLPFWRSIAIEQDLLEDVAVDRAFRLWFKEASLVPGYLPASTGGAPDHQWFWDGQELLDPREAGATDTALKNGSLTYPAVYAKRGKDIDTEWQADAAAMGISIKEYREKVMAQRWPVKAEPVAAPAPARESADERDTGTEADDDE